MSNVSNTLSFQLIDRYAQRRQKNRFGANLIFDRYWKTMYDTRNDKKVDEIYLPLIFQWHT